MLVVHSVLDNTIALFVVLKPGIGTLHGANLRHNAYYKQGYDGQGKNAVENIGNNLHICGNGIAIAQGLNTVLLVKHATEENRPSRKGNQNAGRRASGVHHIG